MISFLIGVFIGASLGFFLAALLAINRNKEGFVGHNLTEDSPPPESIVTMDKPKSGEYDWI